MQEGGGRRKNVGGKGGMEGWRESAHSNIHVHTHTCIYMYMYNCACTYMHAYTYIIMWYQGCVYMLYCTNEA